MWVLTRPRSEHDKPFLINLDHCTRVNISPLGEKWFVEVVLGSDTFPIASTNSEDEADAMLAKVFESLKANEKALDLQTPDEEPLLKPALQPR